MVLGYPGIQVRYAMRFEIKLLIDSSLNFIEYYIPTKYFSVEILTNKVFKLYSYNNGLWNKVQISGYCGKVG